MAVAGVNNVVITVFLANTVDYGELKNGRREESVIFSMQTFVVKLASGIAAFIIGFSEGKSKGVFAKSKLRYLLDISLGVISKNWVMPVL